MHFLWLSWFTESRRRADLVYNDASLLLVTNKIAKNKEKSKKNIIQNLKNWVKFIALKSHNLHAIDKKKYV